MMQFLKPGAAAAATIIALDFVWLGLVMTPFYVKHLNELLAMNEGRMTPHFPSAALVYVFLAAGVVAFVLPNSGEGGWGTVFLKGALFGLITYGVYDFTNAATLKTWPLVLAVTDVAWGAFVCGAASVAAFAVSRSS